MGRLGQHASPHVAAILPFLAEANMHLRWAAVEALGKLPGDALASMKEELKSWLKHSVICPGTVDGND